MLSRSHIDITTNDAKTGICLICMVVLRVLREGVSTLAYILTLLQDYSLVLQSLVDWQRTILLSEATVFDGGIIDGVADWNVFNAAFHLLIIAIRSNPANRFALWRQNGWRRLADTGVFSIKLHIFTESSD